MGPDFSSPSCRISTASPAYVCGIRQTLSVSAGSEALLAFTGQQVNQALPPECRFHVAQSGFGLGRKGQFQPLAPVAAARAPLRARSFSTVE